MSDNNFKIVTRMAPSPTGRFHVGGVRTALYNYLFARKHKGSFILRIEDTDKERNDEAYEKEIYEVFEWCGLDTDQVFRQSEHLPRHQELLRQLIQEGKAYEAEEAKDQTGKVIRFKNPNMTISFQDSILGSISIDTTDLGDFVIARNHESPLYHLAVVIDDYDEGVTHVIRAQEHLANTPRQILLQQALGFNQPVYAHVPFILGPDGKKKLSKRDGRVAALEYRDEGYLPEALLNFLVMIGWNPGTEQEIFSKEELTNAFSLEQVQKGPARYNLEKLDWINKQWLQKLSLEEFENYIQKTTEVLSKRNHEIFKALVPIIRERISNLRELREMIERGDFEYFFTQPVYKDPKQLIWKDGNKEMTQTHLAYIYESFNSVKQWNKEFVKDAIWSYAEKEGKGDVLWPLRYTLSGQEKSPDPFTIATILGKEETLQRINKAIKTLEAL